MSKQFTKRSLSFLLALVMLLSLVPFGAFATEAETTVIEEKEARAAAEHWITDYETFITALAYLEEVASVYVMDHPGKDPLALII